jgi:predicted GNAT family acetyltransferase
MFQVVHDEAAGRFETEVDGHAAELAYRVDGDRILMVHTWVPAPIEGRGVGSALVRAAVEEAVRRNLTIVPVCSFVRGWLDRHPEVEAKRA